MRTIQRLAKREILATPALPALNPLVSASQRVLSRWPDVVANPPEKDREAIVAEMRDRLQYDRWTGATMRLATSAARAVFDEVRRDRPDLAALRAFYVAETGQAKSGTFVSAMMSVYIATFEPGARHTRDLAMALNRARDLLSARWSSLLHAVPDMLDPARAHLAIASLMERMDSPWTELKALGLRSPHAPGLMDHAHFAYVERLKPHLRTRAGLGRLFQWLKPDGQAPRMTGASEAIAAVLGHWRHGNPPAADVEHITQTLVGFYRDPRVHPGGAWAGVPRDLLDVILRWLTGENIRFFMDIVSEVEDSHMWAPRREFWLGLHEKGFIDAAWVAFSPSGAELARRRLASVSGPSTLRYGIQTAGGTRSTTSLLVLKAGNKIIVEGSHTYKIHIFRSSDPRAPLLYKSTYDCEEIRKSPSAESKSHNGYWEGWVLERI